ncbi:hypothetical protein [Tabrizicola fusiformis]|uniref:hypothetical protein n=1 Tax=Tabrizicola sp. SY72 TaxID=2741673 RepID=UPI001574B36E|nr:hypothetical protein [Tabrizicola sp. SY72]NTT86918.1 hypothetical protein [Tabrizicola sp. SY72]
MNDQQPQTETTEPTQAAAETQSKAKTAKVSKTAPEKVAPPPSVVVKGPAVGRWRAGRHFGAEPVTIPLDDLTEAQLLALQSDPELLVQVTAPPY